MNDSLLLPAGARDAAVAAEEQRQQDRRTPGVVVQPMPCSIKLVNGQTFVVPEVEGWGYVDVGVFATGHFIKSPNKEQNVLIPYERIDYYIMDFDALERFIRAQQEAEDGQREEAGAAESVPEGDPADTDGSDRDA